MHATSHAGQILHRVENAPHPLATHAQAAVNASKSTSAVLLAPASNLFQAEVLGDSQPDQQLNLCGALVLVF
ncbi:hypothetical protein FOA52_013055 [Chlamydomonas sp. UWO 241]|nr:hypothetical protein FOA52_013055 [Chlamydomonas sp. UWO 241]